MSDFKTISEVSVLLGLPQHVLRFWEGQFVQIKPAKRKGGRRFYSEKDVEILEKIKNLLYVKGYTIKGAKKALNQHFVPQIISNEDPESMRKKLAQPDSRQIDIFDMIGGRPAPEPAPAPVAEQPKKAKPGNLEKESLKTLLANQKEMEKILRETA